MALAGSQRRFLLAAVAVVVGSGCLLSMKEQNAVPCTQDSDCVFEDGRSYRCFGTTAEAKFCEVSFPGSALGPGDGGPNVASVFYCTQMKDFMQKYCVSCHAPGTNSSGQTTFMLDHYEKKGTESGVFDMLARIKARTVDDYGTSRQMPPTFFAQQPSVAERDALTAWVAFGGPYAQGSATFDPSVACGEPAGGGGTPVSFTNQVQPILTAKCGGCHAYLASNARAAIVDMKRGCDSTLDLVEPGNLQQSFLWRKLVDDAGTRCMNKMPQGAAELPEAELSLIRTWIQQGAQAN